MWHKKRELYCLSGFILATSVFGAAYEAKDIKSSCVSTATLAGNYSIKTEFRNGLDCMNANYGLSESVCKLRLESLNVSPHFLEHHLNF